MCTLAPPPLRQGPASGLSEFARLRVVSSSAVSFGYVSFAVHCGIGPAKRTAGTSVRTRVLTVRAGSRVESAEQSSAAGTSESANAAPQPSTRGQRASAGYPDSDEEVSAIMEGVSFAQLCDDFQCISSPSIERTARLLARDIHDIKEDKRSLSCFAVEVKYQDPLRSFKGRQLYKRPSWILNGLERPRVNMLGMAMTSTSDLVIRWRLRGDFRNNPVANMMGASLDLIVTSRFVLNQISGQVLEHRDEWDLQHSSPPAVVAFYTSRLAWSTAQSSKDLSDSVSNAGSVLGGSKDPNQNTFIYPDPSGDPRKFFAQDDPNKELYQFAFAVALLYFVVQFLRLVI